MYPRLGMRPRHPYPRTPPSRQRRRRSGSAGSRCIVSCIHIRFCLPFHPLIDLVCSSVGPAVEAFGFERIIFGSAPSPVSRAQSNAGDWYEIAREAFAELGVDQESIDAVFGGNAQHIYAAAGSDGRA
jgi:hypothetical protein